MGLRAPPKAPLQVGAGPSEHAPPVDGGLIGLALVFLFDLAIVLVLNVRFCCRRRFCQYTKWVGGNPACSLQQDRRLRFIYFFCWFCLTFLLYFVFLLDRVCHHFKVDFNKLPRYNLEHNCVVSAWALYSHLISLGFLYFC